MLHLHARESSPGYAMLKVGPAIWWLDMLRLSPCGTMPLD